MVKIRALGSTWLSLSGLSEGCGILTKPRAQNVGTRFDGLSLLRMLKFFLACSVPSAAFESTICGGAVKVDKREDIECPTVWGCSHTHTCTHSLQIRCRYFLEEFQLHPVLFPFRSQESPLHHANPALCTQAPANRAPFFLCTRNHAKPSLRTLEAEIRNPVPISLYPGAQEDVLHTLDLRWRHWRWGFCLRPRDRSR